MLMGKNDCLAHTDGPRIRKPNVMMSVVVCFRRRQENRGLGQCTVRDHLTIVVYSKA